MSGVETVHAPVEEFSPEQVAAVEGHARAYGARHALEESAVEELLAMLFGAPEVEERVSTRRWKTAELVAELDGLRPWDEPGVIAERLGTTAAAIQSAARRAGHADLARAFAAEASREAVARRRARDESGAER